MKILHLLQTSLRARFIVGVGVMLLPLAVLAAGAFFSLQRTTASLKEVVEEAIDELEPIAHLQIALLKTAMPANDYVIHSDPAERELFVRLSQEVEAAFEGALSAPFSLTEEQELVRSAYKEWQQARALSEAILALPHPVGDPTAAQETERLDAHIDRAVEILDRLDDLAHREINEEWALIHALRRRMLLIIAAVFGVGLGAAVVAGVALSRSVLLPLRVLEEGAGRFGAGDLSHRVALDRKDELGQLARVFNAMVERLAKSQAALEDLSIRDGLTGLYNRREFQRRLEEEVHRSQRYGRYFSLLMLDIDHFKATNDTYGHQAGDEALRAVASLVSGEVRDGDIAARYGGEEVTVILSETPISGALALAERIRSAIAAHAMTVAPEQTIGLTVSVGVATFPEDAKSGEEIVFAADQALYTAKRAGRNRVCRFGR